MKQTTRRFRMGKRLVVMVAATLIAVFGTTMMLSSCSDSPHGGGGAGSYTLKVLPGETVDFRAPEVMEPEILTPEEPWILFGYSLESENGYKSFPYTNTTAFVQELNPEYMKLNELFGFDTNGIITNNGEYQTLDYIALPSAVTGLDSKAIINFPNIKVLDLSKSRVSTIGEKILENCGHIRTLIIPSSITTQIPSIL